MRSRMVQNLKIFQKFPITNSFFTDRIAGFTAIYPANSLNALARACIPD